MTGSGLQAVRTSHAPLAPRGRAMVRAVSNPSRSESAPPPTPRFWPRLPISTLRAPLTLCSECWAIRCGERAGPPPVVNRFSESTPASRPGKRGAAMIGQLACWRASRCCSRTARSTACTATTVCSSACLRKCPAVPGADQAGNCLRSGPIAECSACTTPQELSPNESAAQVVAEWRVWVMRASCCDSRWRIVPGLSGRFRLRLGGQLGLNDREQIADGYDLLEIAAVQADAELRLDPQHDTKQIDRIELETLAYSHVVACVLGPLPSFLLQHIEPRRP